MKDFNHDFKPKITTGFVTPDFYFDTFSAKVLSKLPTPKSHKTPFFNNAKKWYYAAAAIFVLGISIPYYMQYSIHKEEYDSRNLENYIFFESTISQDDIVNLLEQDDIENIKMELHIQDTDALNAL